MCIRDRFYIDQNLVLHPIPDGGTYECFLQVEDKQLINNVSDTQVDSFERGNTATCVPLRTEWQDSVVEEPDGTAWFVDNNLVRHWIPNGGTYNCLVGWQDKDVSTRNASQPEIDRLTEGNQQTCTPSEARDTVIRKSNGTAYFVDSNLQARWIPNGGTYNCLRSVKGAPEINNVSDIQVDAFARGPNMGCEALLVGPDGTAFHVINAGTRHWVPDGGVFVCLENRGIPVFRYETWDEINLFTERPDDWASCRG